MGEGREDILQIQFHRENVAHEIRQNLLLLRFICYTYTDNSRLYSIIVFHAVQFSRAQSEASEKTLEKGSGQPRTKPEG